jgi:hypothetical protein
MAGLGCVLLPAADCCRLPAGAQHQLSKSTHPAHHTLSDTTPLHHVLQDRLCQFLVIKGHHLHGRHTVCAGVQKHTPCKKQRQHA